MQKILFGLFISKFCLSLSILLYLLLVLPYNAAARSYDKLRYYDTVTARWLYKLDYNKEWPNPYPFSLNEHILPEIHWYATMWVGTRPLRTGTEPFHSHGYFSLSDISSCSSLQVRAVGGLKKPLVDHPPFSRIGMRVEDLTESRRLYVFDTYETSVLEVLDGVSNVAMLDLSNNNISDMREVAALDMPTLSYLDLSSNSVTRAELPGDFPRLKFLILYGNKIDEIALANLPLLIDLDLSFNKLNDMGKLAGLDTPELRYLDLSGNGITKAEMPVNLPKLDELDLSSNKINEITLYNLPELTFLDLSNNASLTSLQGLSSLTALRKLDISRTKVNNLQGLEGLTNLKELKVSNETKLQAIEGLENLTSLQFLYIANWRTRDITGLDTLTNLRELHLHGEIAELGGFDNLHNLQKLTIIGQNALPLKIEGLDNLSALQELNLKGIFLHIEGLDSLTQLEKLSISSILLKRIEGLDRLINLKSLDLHGGIFNKIENLDKLTELEFLYLHSDEPIAKLENLKALVNLKELALPGCKISDIKHLGGLPRPEILETLNLAGNKIETFPLYRMMVDIEIAELFDLPALPNLKNLNLRNNPLKDGFYGLSGCPDLETLNMGKTQISNIKSITRLTKLRELDLSQNTLESLDGLETLENLQKLNLYESQLDTIKKVPPGLRYLILENSSITNLDFLSKGDKRLDLQVLSAANSRIGGVVDFSCSPNLKYIDLSNCRLAGIKGFEYLPFDAYLNLQDNSLPLSQIYPLIQDVSYRIWEIGRFQHNILFETLELERNQALDLSSEKEFGGIRTYYMVEHKFVENNKTKWNKAAQGSDYTINDGVITFIKAGEYRINMTNDAVMQYPQYDDFKPYPIKAYTGIISVL